MPRLSLLAAAVLLGASAPAARAQAPEVPTSVSYGPGVADVLAGTSCDGRPRVAIVTFYGERGLRPEQLDAVVATGARPVKIMQALPMVGLETTPEQLRAVAALPGVRSVYLDARIGADLDRANIASGVAATRSEPVFMGLNGGRQITGRGIGVMVNDSGVDGNHLDLEFGSHLVNNIRGSSNAQENPPVWEENVRDTDVGGGHGTHCAGIIGGNGTRSDGRYTGVAPGADLIGFGSGAGISILHTAGGFDYALYHHKDYNIRVISNSFGNTGDTTAARAIFDPNDPTNVATKALADAGVVVVFSAGNSGSRNGTITGNWKKAPWVITVAAGDDKGQLASFSSRGRTDNGTTSRCGQVTVGGEAFTWCDQPTITAPGVDVASVRAAAGPSTSTTDATRFSAAHLPYYTVLSGTSMACPHVAGVVALMLEANPSLTWREVKNILVQTATPMPGSPKPWEAGAGYVNAHAAVARAFNLDATPYLRTAASFSAGSSQSMCATPTIAADASGDATTASTDITGVTMHSETSADFRVTLDVGNLATDNGCTAASCTYYDVHFTLDKPEEAPVTYILSANRALAGAWTHRLTVRTADGTTRPSTAAAVTITGETNVVTNQITFVVPKNQLTVTATPATTTAPVTRTSRPARQADRLTTWATYTYTRAGTTTPDGAGVYNDQAAGACFKVLTVE